MSWFKVLKDDSYEPRWDEGQFYGQGSAYY